MVMMSLLFYGYRKGSQQERATFLSVKQFFEFRCVFSFFFTLKCSLAYGV